MKLNWYFISLGLLAVIGLSYQQSSCTTDTSYKYMSTKTDYTLVANTTNFYDYSIQNCEQIGYWHLSRHGARYPDYEDIVDMNDFLPKLKNLVLTYNQSWLCKKDLEQLKNWVPKMVPDDDNYLTENGKEVMKGLGARMYGRLKNLISQTKMDTQINIRTTDIIRTIQSANEFIDGAFSSLPTRPKTETVKQEDDFLLKFPDLCEKFIIDVDNNNMGCDESTVFNSFSNRLKEARVAFRIRLGLPPSYGSTNKAFDYAVKTCQYEYLIDQTNSVWCKFFDRDILNLLEYREDIKYHCKYGYKYDITRLMTCDLVKNLLSNLKNFKKGYEELSANAKKIQLLFAHSSTMLPFFATLGIGKSKDNFNLSNILEENQNRKYKITKMDPMNSNVAFVLYDCKNNPSLPKYTLRAFHNENLFKPDGCKSTDCSLDDFSNYLSFFTNYCVSTDKSCKVY